MENKTIFHINNVFFDNPLKFDDLRLIQIGRRFCEASAIIPAHPHLNWFELTIATSGSGIVYTNNQPHKISAGDIYLSFPCDIHEIRATDKEKFEYDFLSFYCKNGKWNSALEEIIQNYRSPEKRTFRDDKIIALSCYKLLGKVFTIKTDYAKLLKSYKENGYGKTRYYLEIERDG